MGMQEDYKQTTALHLASEKGHKEIVIEYVMREEDYENNTALHYACVQGNEKIVKLLLNVFSAEKKGKLIEYVTKQNVYSQKATYLATQNGHAKIVELLNIVGM